ncbi:hypothetical protein BH11PLA1_BH11PLA1_20780 [soil metagenome]
MLSARGDDPAPGGPAVPPPTPGSSPAAPTKSGDAALPEAVITLRDGRAFTGLLVTKTPDGFILRIAGIDTTFAAPKVESYRVLEPALDRYHHMRAAIDDDDAPQLLQLIDFLTTRDLLTEAVKEAEALAARQPSNPDAKAKLQRLTQLIDLKQSESDAADNGGPMGGRPEQGDPTLRQPVPLLTVEQANLIKVYELDLDKAPAVLVPRGASEAVFARYAGDPLVPPSKEGRDALIREGSGKMLELMFRLRARDFYPQVKVLRTPDALRAFREDVQQPLLLVGCATSGCHGGTSAGRFMLAAQRAQSERAALTNFYILSNFKTDAGKSLLDFDHPEKSALIQLALPREQSTYPHPAVPSAQSGVDQWRPALRGRADGRIAQIVKWMGGLFQPRPKYDVGYQPARPLAPLEAGAGGPGSGATGAKAEADAPGAEPTKPAPAPATGPGKNQPGEK